MAAQEPVFLELLVVAVCGCFAPMLCVTCPKQCDCGQSFTQINCSSRGITDVPRGIYENTSELLLKANAIESLRRDQFLRLRQLERLDLNENVIMTIQEGAFNGLYRLQILNLRRNRLRSLQGGMFRYLTNLRELTLQGNPIICLEAYTFSHLPSLRKLDLRELRQLKAISRNAFNGLTALRNPWNCTCVVHWLARWLQEHMRNDTSLLQLQRCGGCFSPVELRRKLLCDVPLSSLKCKRPQIHKVHPTVNATVGGNAALQCELSPGVETAISWITPDGSRAKRSSFRGGRVKVVNDGTLNISRVTMSDAGVYRCMATNDAGFDNFYKILNVTGSILPEFAATQVPINLDDIPEVDDFDVSYCTNPRGDEDVFLLNRTQYTQRDVNLEPEDPRVNPTADATKIPPMDSPTQKDDDKDTFMTLYKGYLIAALVAAVSLGTLLWILVCAVMKCSKERNRDDRKNKRLAKLKKEEASESRFNVSCVKSIDPEETVEIPDVYTRSKATLGTGLCGDDLRHNDVVSPSAYELGRPDVTAVLENVIHHRSILIRSQNSIETWIDGGTNRDITPECYALNAIIIRKKQPDIPREGNAGKFTASSLKTNMTEVVPKRFEGIEKESLFQPLVTPYNTRGHSLEIKNPPAKLEIRKRSFEVRTVPAWNQLPGKVVHQSSVNGFKSSIDSYIKTVFDGGATRVYPPSSSRLQRYTGTSLQFRESQEKNKDR
ncbi:Leucine-rich repeat-containing protein 4C [Branchiostoma belcheri]|nr:Leucine-rich repeat-containing protein 4C [Branchiostoma belcheri]